MSLTYTKFAQVLLATVTMAHYLHFRTPSVAQHEALGEFYEELQKLSDKYIETSIAVYGPLGTDHLVNLRFSGYGARTLLECFIEILDENRVEIDHPGLLNTLDDISTLTLQTLYKVKNLI